MTRLGVVALVTGITVSGAVWLALRSRRLRFREAALWAVIGLGGLVLGVAPRLIDDIAPRLGIIDPPNLVFIIAIVALTGLVAMHSTALQASERRGRVLGQELALRSIDLPTEPPRLLIITPAWNESETIAGVVAEVLRSRPDAVMLVVDDGSEDDTAELARGAGALVASLPVNLGVGGAVGTGYRFASRCRAQRVVVLDADGQHPPAGIDALLAALDDGADLAVGDRFHDGTYDVHGARRLAVRLLAKQVSAAVGSPINDVTSGFRAAGPQAIALFANDFPTQYLGDTIEATMIAARSGLDVRGVAVTMRTRQGGEASHRGMRSAFYLLRAVVATAVVRPRSLRS